MTLSKYRIDAHIMFSLARGKVSESAARLALAKEMMKVGTSWCVNLLLAGIAL